MTLKEKLIELSTIYNKKQISEKTGLDRVTLWRVKCGENFTYRTFLAIEKLHSDSKRKIAARKRAAV